jgi:hypothetical protein
LFEAVIERVAPLAVAETPVVVCRLVALVPGRANAVTAKKKKRMLESNLFFRFLWLFVLCIGKLYIHLQKLVFVNFQSLISDVADFDEYDH